MWNKKLREEISELKSIVSRQGEVIHQQGRILNTLSAWKDVLKTKDDIQDKDISLALSSIQALIDVYMFDKGILVAKGSSVGVMPKKEVKLKTKKDGKVHSKK